MTNTAKEAALSQSLPRQPLIPNAVLGMLLFIGTEAMLFAALISAFTIAQAATSSSWPPPGQFRLPIAETAANSLVLVFSGLFLFFASRSFARKHKNTGALLLISIFLGTFFVVVQGTEWTKLLHEGLTMRSSTYGSFFYLIIGLHALHAIVALGLLAATYWKLRRGTLTRARLWQSRVLWYFVVGIWPILYWQVYL